LAHAVLEGTRSKEAVVSGAAGQGRDIGPSAVLPAHREDVELHTDDGLTLVGELARPIGPANATLVTLHPLPTAGGFMDSHVLRKASCRLPALAGINVLRFNTRGTCSPRGCSEGVFDEARAEGLDLEAAVRFVRERGLPNVWLLGWSFGTDVALKHGLVEAVEGAILMSPPLRFTTGEDLDEWAADGRPVTALVPEHDDFLKPAEARERFARVPQAEVVAFDEAVHLWVGERQVRQVLDAVVERVAPSAAPITWTMPDA
jgi:alpha/beta superfamily hydrolase